MQNTRSDKLETAMAEALESYGITNEGYLTLVSKHGYTVYLGGVEVEDHQKIAKILATLDELVLEKPATTTDEPS